MKERPILFSGAMVRAILDGTKTQTRRVAAVESLRFVNHINATSWAIRFSKPNKGALASYAGGNYTEEQARRIIASQYCPYGQSGDLLWVRETYCAFGHWKTCYNAKKQRDEWHFVDMTLESGKQYRFAADMIGDNGARQRGGMANQWWKRPSIFMPRRASRITLEITGVRIERLNDISGSDAVAEGVRSRLPDNGIAVSEYQDLWESINGPGSWDLNPWVWRIEFKVVEAAK